MPFLVVFDLQSGVLRFVKLGERRSTYPPDVDAMLFSDSWVNHAHYRPDGTQRFTSVKQIISAY